MSNQLVLFNSSSIEERYRSVFGKREKMATTKAGVDYVQSTTIRALPLHSKDGPCMAKATGKVGADLEAFAVEANRAALEVAFKAMQAKKDSGLYVFKSCTVSRRGDVSLAIKPVAGGLMAMTDDQVLAMAKSRGFVIAEGSAPAIADKPAVQAAAQAPAAEVKPAVAAPVTAPAQATLPLAAAAPAPAKTPVKKSKRSKSVQTAL